MKRRPRLRDGAHHRHRTPALRGDPGVECGGRQRTGHQTKQHVGLALIKPARQQGHAQGHKRHHHRARVYLVQMRAHADQQCAGAVRVGRRHAQPVLQGMHGDQDCRAAGKAKQGRWRNEVRQRPQAQRAHQPLHEADQHGNRQRQFDVARAAGNGQRCQHREQGQRVGIRRARHDMTAGPEQRRDNTGNDRGIQAVFGGQPGQRGKGHALRQHQQGP
ncbi:hypothetical protein D3C71_1140200 [compost metagenome]